MHDPFAMRPFFGYNFGEYIRHWLSFQKRDVKLPKIFHVNWFRRSPSGEFLWPGFGENVRVLDWIFRRCDGDPIATETPIGWVPKLDSLNLEGLKVGIDMNSLVDVDKSYWMADIDESHRYLSEVLNMDMPETMLEQLERIRQRLIQ